ncbi:uncharacterized protein G2W53_017572 [Senna tora]|uniref:Uncharacterized protein n=1 Tax=Senna tora TaxID=362788 RepID=A0A834TPG8_9FABA|nr:uncharacterized protein G2W53_017572 [Senna tora]
MLVAYVLNFQYRVWIFPLTALHFLAHSPALVLLSYSRVGVVVSVLVSPWLDSSNVVLASSPVIMIMLAVVAGMTSVVVIVLVVC